MKNRIRRFVPKEDSYLISSYSDDLYDEYNEYLEDDYSNECDLCEAYDEFSELREQRIEESEAFHMVVGYLLDELENILNDKVYNEALSDTYKQLGKEFTRLGKIIENGELNEKFKE